MEYKAKPVRYKCCYSCQSVSCRYQSAFTTGAAQSSARTRGIFWGVLRRSCCLARRHNSQCQRSIRKCQRTVAGIKHIAIQDQSKRHYKSSAAVKRYIWSGHSLYGKCHTGIYRLEYISTECVCCTEHFDKNRRYTEICSRCVNGSAG